MSKFKIEKNPTFKAEVSIPRLGGEPIKVPFEFKAFTRAELSKAQDKWLDNDTDIINDSSDKINHSEFNDKYVAVRVKQLSDIIHGWGFDDPLNDESIANLINTIIGSDDAILRTFFKELEKARLGN